MKIRNYFRSPAPFFAVLLLLIGLFVSSRALMAFLRPPSTDFSEKLLLGATLFRAGLVLLGVLILGLYRLPIWKSEKKIDNPPASLSKVMTGLLAALLLVSFALRLIQLNAGLWLDEIFTYTDYARLPLGEIVTTYRSENQHILFSILAHLSFLLFGESAWALRLPAVLFGVGSIWALYRFGRTVSDQKEGLLAAALLAFSYHHVWFSQNARGYTGLLFWTIVASWILLKALRESRAKLWVWYAITAALGMYTHLTMAFVIFGHFIVYLVTFIRRRHVEWPKRLTGMFLGFCFAGFLTLLLYSLVLPQMFVAAEESVVAEWRNPLWTLLEFVNGVQVGFSGFSGGAVVLGALVMLVGLTLVGIGLRSYYVTQPDLLLLLFVPTIVGAGLTVSLGHHLWPRFFFFAFGFGALVLVRGVLLFGRWAGRLLRFPPTRSYRLGLIFSIGMILISAVSMVFAYGPKQDFDGALAFIEAQKAPGDAVVTVSLTAKIYERFYDVDWDTVTSNEELDAIRSKANRTWILYTFPPVLQSLYPDVMESIKKEFSPIKGFYGSARQGEILVRMADD